MNTERAKLQGPVFMDSGLAAPRRPGMTRWIYSAALAASSSSAGAS
jgi:hypothetical protein